MYSELITNKCTLIYDNKEMSANCTIKKENDKMTCNCKECKIVKVTSMVLNKGVSLTLNTTEIDLTNLKCFKLIACKNLPEGATTEQVLICPSNSTSLPLFSMSGNYVRADEIRCRCVYPIVYGNDPKHYSLKTRIPKTGYEVI